VRYSAAMKFLIWSVVVILILALVNAIASWFGLDIAAAAPAEETHQPAHGHGTDHPIASTAAPAPHH